MKKIIDSCPSRFVTNTNKDCYVAHDYPEDIYFATGLVGHNAPLPSPIEAALFGKKMKLYWRL